MARELGISVPVVAKHVKILEDAELVERVKLGNTHMLKAKSSNIYSILDSFAENKHIEVEEGTTLMEALSSVSVVEYTQHGDSVRISSVDGEDGFYLYEVNGKLSNKTVDKFKFEDDAVIDWKKMIPVTRKKIFIKIKNKDK